MSPLEVEILLHYHYSTDNFPNWDAPAQFAAITKFVNMGLLRRDTGCSVSKAISGVQEPLDLYVKAICAVPLPKQKWVIELPDDERSVATKA